MNTHEVQNELLIPENNPPLGLPVTVASGEKVISKMCPFLPLPAPPRPAFKSLFLQLCGAIVLILILSLIYCLTLK